MSCLGPFSLVVLFITAYVFIYYTVVFTVECFRYSRVLTWSRAFSFDCSCSVRCFFLWTQILIEMTIGKMNDWKSLRHRHLVPVLSQLVIDQLLMMSFLVNFSVFCNHCVIVENKLFLSTQTAVASIASDFNSQQQWSVARSDFIVQCSRTKFASQTFSAAGSEVWNHLLQSMQSATTFC